MDEEIFNMELRKFLKKVGVTSQREIETAVRDALDSGKLKGSETLKVKAVLSIESLGLSHDIDGDIKLGCRRHHSAALATNHQRTPARLGQHSPPERKS